VKEVRKHRKQGREDYGVEHDQWIAETGLPHAKEAIEDYWARYLS